LTFGSFFGGCTQWPLGGGDCAKAGVTSAVAARAAMAAARNRVRMTED
jgi:hypothetical protein